jgi:HNH endonuclease
MLTELKDTADAVFHNTFQNWRKQNPRGIFLTVETKMKANLHGAACHHLGPTNGLAEDDGRSLTKKLKVLGDGPGSLNKWAEQRSVIVHLCKHCLRDKLIDESQRAVAAPAGAGADMLPSHPFANELAEELAILDREDLSQTEKESLIRARRGQGRYRQDLEKIEIGCRLSGTIDRRHLRASHMKPWSVSNDQEKLDPNNGLLLSPHVDHLFGRGYISFTDEGDLLVSKALNPVVLTAWGLTIAMKKKAFSEKQRVYLAYHRKNVFEKHGRTKEFDEGEPSAAGISSTEIVLREIVPGSG